ncbi:MAG: glycosyltransferase [Firmicutes bacterium]|nr:glycosyltransferase [Bacillota bacterium]
MLDLPSVSIVITTKNRCSSLILVLQKLADQTYPLESTEVFVIDAGTDDTKNNIKKLRSSFPYSLKYKHWINSSISAARNFGIKKSKGEYIIIIDDDVLPVPSFVEAHIKAHLLYPNSLIQGELLPAPGTALLDKARLLEIAQARRDDSSGMNHCNAHTFNLSGPKTLFLQEPFNEEIDRYGWEDVECGYRIITKRNAKLKYSREALAFHYKPKQSAQGVAKENFEGSKGMVYFLTHHPGFILHGDSCLLKRHGEWLVKKIKNFIPLSKSEIKKKLNYEKLLEAKTNITESPQVWEEINNFYHEIELYAAQEGAWCQLYDLPVEKSAFCAAERENYNTAIQFPIRVKDTNLDDMQDINITLTYKKILQSFCSHNDQPFLEIQIFPSKNENGLTAPRTAALCDSSAYTEFPSFLSKYREIWVPSEFDKILLKKIKKTISTFPYPFSSEQCSHALLHPSIEMPETFLFVSDGGQNPETKNFPILIETFWETFKNEDSAALILAFPKSKKSYLSELIWKIERVNRNSNTPLILTLTYDTEKERKQIIASSDCVIYAGIGESLVLSLYEGAAMGKGILATEFGGHLDFLDSKSAYLIPCQIMQKGWRPAAIPQKNEMRELLREIYVDRKKMLKKGVNAKIRLLEKRGIKAGMREAFRNISRAISSSLSLSEQEAFF